MATAMTTGTVLNIEELRRALAVVDPAVATRSTRPILTNVLLADGTITATNLELRIVAPLAGAAEPVVLPYQRLKSIVASTVDADSLELRVDGTSCRITAGAGRWVLPTEDAAEFPTGSDIDAKAIARLPADQFVAMARSVLPAPAKNEPRYAGVQIEFVDGTLSLVATDGKRMAVSECEIDQATDDASAFVPRVAVEALVRAAAGRNTVQLETTGQELVASVDDVTVCCALLSGTFPKWRMVEPEHTTEPTYIRAGELLSACSMAAVCASETSRGVQWTVGEKGLRLQAKSAEFGESVARVGVDQCGHECSFTINPIFAIEWLRTIDAAEAISIEAKDAESAVLFRSEASRITVMPLVND